MTDLGAGTGARGADDDVVSLCSDLIRIDTTNRGNGPAGAVERPAAEYVAERLAEAGIEPTLVEAAPLRTSVLARVAGTDRGADALLIHGHLDVVPADPPDWRIHPFSGEVTEDCVWRRSTVGSCPGCGRSSWPPSTSCWVRR